MLIRAGVLTLSDRSSAGEYEDRSGPAIMEELASLDIEWARINILPDEEKLISQTLSKWADDDKLDLILTTGGTGPAPRDRTPEATLSILDFEIPGIPESMRAAGRDHVPTAALARGVAGVRGETVIINLPGSPKAVREGLDVLKPLLVHLIQKVKGDPSECCP
ncbi:MAG: molybdopterin adenylyltransferase [bacterium]